MACSEPCDCKVGEKCKKYLREHLRERRERIATVCLQGLLANSHFSETASKKLSGGEISKKDIFDILARDSIEAADVLIKELDK